MGSGCVPLYHLMEDAATAEISRTQVWQWVRHQAKMSDGTIITAELVKKMIDEELEGIRKSIGSETYERGRFRHAAVIFKDMSTQRGFPEFLTLIAYEYID